MNIIYFTFNHTIFSECDCNEEGSKNITCNQISGACNCNPGWKGNKCQGNLKSNNYLESNRPKYDKIQLKGRGVKMLTKSFDVVYGWPHKS